MNGLLSAFNNNTMDNVLSHLVLFIQQLRIAGYSVGPETHLAVNQLLLQLALQWFQLQLAPALAPHPPVIRLLLQQVPQ